MNQLPDIIKVNGVRGYVDENNTAWLNVEDIARGLGFTETAASGNITIRWRTVRSYLKSVGYQPVAESCDDINTGDYIPENMFYRLAMKASNAAAEKFQSKVADEILPSIRKHGIYATDNFIETALANPDFAIKILTELKERRAENAVLKTQLADLQPKASYCDLILNCKELVSVSQIAKDYGMSAKTFNTLLNKLGIQFKQGDVWLLYQKYARQGWTSTKTHNYLGTDGDNHCKVHTYWTQKGRFGLYELLKQNGYLPTIERNAA